MSPPLALSDDQLDQIMRLAAPLQPQQRAAFLEMLATKLNSSRELGDGMVYRAARELQREYFSPPTFNVDSGASRSRRRIDDDDEDDRPRRRVAEWPTRCGTA
jgi:hypothetical protein